MKNKVCLLFVILNLFFSLSAQADQSELQDQKIIEKVKQKKYLNGAEEGELQIQAKLYKPQRKISPVVEQVEEEQPSNERD